MADLYLSSVTGNDANSGLTSFANGKATLSAISAIDNAGDTVRIGSAHFQTAAPFSYISPGTLAAPVKLVSVNETSGLPEPGARFATTAASAVWGGTNYTYGVTFDIVSASSTIWTMVTDALQTATFEDCTFKMTPGGSSSNYTFGNTGSGASGCMTRLIRPLWHFGNVGQRILFNHNVSVVGASIEPTNKPTNLYTLAAQSRGAMFTDDGSDYSNLALTGNLVGAISGFARATFRNCRLPAAWAGQLALSGVMRPGGKVALYNTDSSVSVYQVWIELYEGVIRSDTAVFRTGGATHAGVNYSFRMASNGVASFNGPLVSDEIARPFPANATELAAWTPGDTKTITFYTVTDGVTLTDQDFEVRVSYMDSASDMQGAVASDGPAHILSGATNKVTSTVGWTTTGITTPVKQEHTVSFVPQQRGVWMITLLLKKASTTVYVCPSPVVT